MKISVDTNILARAVLNDDPSQSLAARKLLKEAIADRRAVAVFVRVGLGASAGCQTTQERCGDGRSQSDECGQRGG